jgi:hypothetical protein
MSHFFDRKAAWAVRLFWLALVAVHISPLLAVLHHAQAGLTLDVLAKIAGIVMSMAFFGSKAMGVRFLRVRNRRLGIVAFFVVCGLVHQQVRQEIVAQGVVPVAAIVCIAAAIPRTLTLRKLRAALLGIARTWSRIPLLRVAWRRLAQLEPFPPRLLLGFVSAVPRGPPAI